MRKGTLIRDAKTDRMVIRYGIKEYSSGLHCGTPLEVKVGSHWRQTRIEYDGTDWYLDGIRTEQLEGLSVRTGRE
mgnify:CR=1 FL=1